MITHVVVALDDFALRLDTEGDSAEAANYLTTVGVVTQAAMRERRDDIERAFSDCLIFGRSEIML
jgi:hypothetical protein